MTMFGVSYGFHDAAYCHIDGQDIIEAHHSERHSRKKNDSKLHTNINGFSIFYEKPYKKNIRRLLHGQKWVKRDTHNAYVDHHWSHAAAAYYTRPFKEEPVCVVIDAIGEWDTASIWYNKKKKWSMRYPKSLGLFYSAMTKYVGLKPMEDEYILMGMSALGHPTDLSHLLYANLHKGYLGPKLKGSIYDIAAGAQSLIEKEILSIMNKARKYSSSLCYGGGVALNCVANTKVYSMFNNVWILPNPGDAGSSLGAAAAYLDKPINWIDPYLGTNIERKINPKEVVQYLLKKSVCGIANGRAEFGPRALGNRSLLADPRLDIKNTVNDIKRRQRFRPFAPAILEEYADEYFKGPMNEYMQYVAVAKHDYNSVTHIDGTARVQIVKANCNSIIRPVLEEWYEQTKCPMLLNTSLNVKGKPMVDNINQAKGFEKLYGVKVF